MTKYLRIPVLLASIFLFCGWGNTGHRIINNRTVYSFPAEMISFRVWQPLLESHASDADNRKGSDPNEAPKHYIDIDNYPEFINTGSIPQDFDSLVDIYGYSFVIDQGILPWAIITTFDSLKQSFSRKDGDKAILFAADLGHYVGDAHMPLHITKNYNGQFTNQSGIHSRYESSLIGRYSGEITFDCDSAGFIEDVPAYVFAFLYSDYVYVDSVLAADLSAKAIAGNTSSDLYYQKFWEFSGSFTKMLFKNSSFRLAELIYTAWTLAGKPSNISDARDPGFVPGDFELGQNYPNPFNPSTTINFTIPEPGNVSLKIYDLQGELVAVPFEGFGEAGPRQVDFNGANLSSGMYIYTLSTASGSISRKMIVLK